MWISSHITVTRNAELSKLLRNMKRQRLASSKKKNFENDDVDTMLLGQVTRLISTGSTYTH